MSKFVKIAGLGLALLLALFISASSAYATRYDMQGLVFMDNNLNGIWDVGEPGYNGQWQWVENEEMFRYVGATITILTPAYDEYEVETMGYRDLEEHEEVFCTQQDLFLEDDELNPNPVRPCAGTWGFPVSVEDVYMQITLTPPDGYYVTSQNPLFCVTGEKEWMDFGLAPVAESEVSTEEAAAGPSFHMTVEAKDIVPGLVFIDTNLDGVWQPGEAGYGGQFMWDADKELTRYVGATVTFISPAYDEYEIETMGYRELEEFETVACTQQDLVIDGELNPNPVRPCSGTFALAHAGEDVYWEVWLAVPQGYYLTTANPQYYITGTGQMPVDFGIAPVTD